MSAYSQLPSFVLGFHGCDASVAESIFAGKTFLQKSQNDFDWLGEGIYFWENNPARALEYAEHLKNAHRKNGPKIIKPAVVGAVINLGQCLNLLDTKYLKLVREAHGGMVRLMHSTGLTLPENRIAGPQNQMLLRDLDCAVINYVHSHRNEKQLSPFDTVRSAFIEGEPLYPTAGFYSRNHIQICVRNTSCIKGYFRPMADGD